MHQAWSHDWGLMYELARTRSGKQTVTLSPPSSPFSSPFSSPISSPPASPVPEPLHALLQFSLPILSPPHSPEQQPVNCLHSDSYSDSDSSVTSFATRLNMSSKNTEVSHSMSSKPPMLSARNVSPEVMRQFENTCRSFFHNKEGLESKDYIACIAGGLQDPLISDWYWTTHKMFDILSFNDFMKEFRLKWLPNDWEQDIRCRVLWTKQAGLFWEWAVKIWSLNTLLRGTPTHLDNTSLLNQLEVNLEPSLSRACDNES